ncbi:hypothetical protein L6452_05764 [Arctium lappa]|uniref:Uncharacterized protein n=1 Tax=Arctium lappa TaxID=4217 RepID=A0ACB9EHM0_ARCLA|nr:hypothetical protein L6452_05764 [Arctium lappa]
MDDIPSGLEAFELAAKFYYGIVVDMTAINISGLWCASGYLEMTEDLEEGNLIFNPLQVEDGKRDGGLEEDKKGGGGEGRLAVVVVGADRRWQTKLSLDKDG